MKTRLLVLAAFGYLLVPQPVAYAATLNDVYQRSLENDAVFLGARYRYDSVSESVKQARALLLPSISGSYEYSGTSQDIKQSDNPVFEQGRSSYETGTLGLELRQPLFRYSAWARLNQAKAEVGLGMLEFEAAQQDLMLRVASLYLGVLAAKDDLQFATAEKVSVKKQLDLVTTRRGSGLATRTDLYDAEARYQLTVANEIAAMNRLEDSHQALRESTGTIITDLALLEREIPLDRPTPDDIDVWVQSTLEQNLELKVREFGVTIAQEEVKRRRGGHYPTLDFVAVYDNRDSDGSLFGGGSEVETADYAIKLELPLYQGGGVSSRVRQAEFDLGAAREERIAQLRLAEREARNAYLGVLSGISRVGALKNSVRAQESALEAKQKGFLAGLNTTINVLDAERDLYLIRRDFAQARYDYLLSTLRLKRANGTLSEADLAQINDMLTEQER